MTIRGYGRVSSAEQRLDVQEDAFRDAGVEVVYMEHASGGSWARVELHRMLDELEDGDVVVVWKLDRVARSLSDLLKFLETLHERGATFKCLTQPVDTSTPAGRLQIQMIGAFAEFERSLIRERTRAGLEAARSRGVRLGRRPGLTAMQVEEIRSKVEAGEWSQAQAARLFGVHRSTVSRAVAALSPPQ